MGLISWAWRHRRGIAVSTVAAAGAYGAYVAWCKKRELEDLLQELLGMGGGGRASREARVREHFAVTQQQADRMLLDALPRLQEQLTHLIDTDAYRQRMRDEGQMSNYERWHEMMVLVVSRLLTAQYALVLSTLQLRVKLNLVSRRDLLEVRGGADGGDGGGERLSTLTKRRFLSNDHMLSEVSLQPLAKVVTACVREHLKEGLSAARLAERLTAEQILQMLAPARADVEAGLSHDGDDLLNCVDGPALNGPVEDSGAGVGVGSSVRNGAAAHEPPAAAVAASCGRRGVLLSFLGEELCSHGAVAEGDQLHRLLSEAHEVLSSDAFRLTLYELVACAFETVSAELRTIMGDSADKSAPRTLPLAKVLAQLHKLAVSTLEKPQPYAHALLATPAIEEFCWMTFV
jgi:hypothetical protein